MRTLNKKAQIAETLTWTVATIIIVVVLTLFFFASNILGGMKEVKQKLSEIQGDIEGSSFNYIDVQTKMALEKNDLDRKKILNWIKEERK